MSACRYSPARPWLAPARAATSRPAASLGYGGCLESALGGVPPVVLQHLTGPRGLGDGAARQELLEDRHQIHHQRAVVSVEVRHMQIPSVDAEQPREGGREASRTPGVVVHEGSRQIG